jgi:hypothetical protein
MSNDSKAALVEALTAVLPGPAQAWLAQALSSLAASQDPGGTLAQLCAAARRELGDEPLGAPAATVETAAGPLAVAAWPRADAGRVALALAAATARPDDSTRIVEAAYRAGDERERAALVRGLALLPDPASLKPIALATGRTNSVPLYSALALDNPFPAAYYSEHELNQLVLKALFIGIPIERVHGLAARANPELSRMCEDYADERLAAGRSVPSDIWLALAPFASAHGEQLLLEHLSSADPAHRYYSATAARTRRPLSAALAGALAERLRVETDARIRAALSASLAH